jgi:hypothetical protein
MCINLSQKRCPSVVLVQGHTTTSSKHFFARSNFFFDLLCGMYKRGDFFSMTSKKNLMNRKLGTVRKLKTLCGRRTSKSALKGTAWEPYMPQGLSDGPPDDENLASFLGGGEVH